jgi:hypothetical protein
MLYMYIVHGRKYVRVTYLSTYVIVCTYVNNCEYTRIRGLQNNSGLVIVTSSVSFLCIVFEDDKLRSWWTNIMA